MSDGIVPDKFSDETIFSKMIFGPAWLSAKDKTTGIVNMIGPVECDGNTGEVDIDSILSLILKTKRENQKAYGKFPQVIVTTKKIYDELKRQTESNSLQPAAFDPIYFRGIPIHAYETRDECIAAAEKFRNGNLNVLLLDSET